jgi:type IV pilus assembly protein PilA
MQKQSKKGFTLVEIMIVVVIIGLLAAMAIPAFQQVREKAVSKTMTNDARLVSAAIQQVAMETGDGTVTIDFGAGTYEVGGATATTVTFGGTLSQGVVGTDATVNIDTGSFSLAHPQVDGNTAVTYDAMQ